MSGEHCPNMLKKHEYFTRTQLLINGPLWNYLNHYFAQQLLKPIDHTYISCIHVCIVVNYFRGDHSTDITRKFKRSFLSLYGKKLESQSDMAMMQKSWQSLMNQSIPEKCTCSADNRNMNCPEGPKMSLSSYTVSPNGRTLVDISNIDISTSEYILRNFNPLLTAR